MAKIPKLGSLGASIGGLLGAGWKRDEARDQLLGPQGQAIDMVNLQQRYAALGVGDYYNLGVTRGTADASSVYNYKISYDYGTAAKMLAAPSSSKPQSPKPESNLAWLDRRVNEMRVAL